MNANNERTREVKSFPPLWKEVSNVCSMAFMKVKKRPSHDLGKDYNDLLAHICDAYGLVYDLTAYECSNYPALVRGSNSTPVVGQTVESTQVLVVYYLLRDLLKRQINNVKTTIHKESINSYLDAFEKYTAGANLVKPIFTYMHWTWQKRGLPPEHVIQPTEIVVGHLWLDVILTQELKDAYKAKVNEIVCRVRSGGATSVGEMESVKRFSLNLGCATDVRLILYSSVVEETYLRSLRAYYVDKKAAYKKLPVADYIKQCVKVVKKEDVLARCFLIRSSYEQVSEEVLRILLHDEKDYLQPYCRDYLDLAQSADPLTHKDFLVTLYNLLGGGEVKSWMEDLLKSTVSHYATRELSAAGAGAGDPAVVLRVLRDALHAYEAMVLKVFGGPKRLRTAIYDGIAENIVAYEKLKDGGDSAAKLAKYLARSAAEEVKTAPLSVLAKKDNWIAILYRLCTKQDEFNRAYTRLLQERIVANIFRAERQPDFAAREESLLSGLLIRDSNFGFVFNCMRMVSDAHRSEQKPPLKMGGVSVKPFVFGAYAWGEARQPKDANMALVPAQLQGVVKDIMTTYNLQKRGRKLIFSPEHSGCRVRMSLSESAAPVTLVVSLLQTRVLLAMNTLTEWTLDALCQSTGIASAECSRALTPFLQKELLKETTPGVFVAHAADAAHGSAPMSYDLRWVDFNAHQSHAGKNSHYMREDETHTLAIQSAIMRRLKEKGPLPLEVVVDSVSTLLKDRSVQRRDIKKVLEKLIEREFVKRSDGLFVFNP